MSKGMLSFLCWLVPTIVFYAICSFTQWNIEIDEWSTACRAVFAILSFASAVYGFFVYTDE